jgi:pimeloyl-ACP methyl ester carboxylesterase
MAGVFRTVAVVVFAAALGAGALAGAGNGAVLAPLEAPFLFSPRPVDKDWLRSLFAAQTRVEEVSLVTPDGVTLRGWLKRPALAPGKRYPLVIVYGGIRREVSGFLRRADAPQDWGWLVVNYRGFGLSGGAATEAHVVEDAKLVYDWAAARQDVDAANIVLLGRSLGTYVAVAVAAARQARAAILATPFDSFVALGEKRFPALPVQWLVGGHFDSAALAPAVSVPALFLLAENDDVTPSENGRALAGLWGGLTRTVTLKGATHFGIERRDDFWRSVRDYLGALRTSAPGSARSRSSGR